jgi:hypothetical protein
MFYFTCTSEHKTFLFFTGLNNKDKYIFGMASLQKQSANIYTVVKELRSKMFGQHLGYFKAVFLKKTQIIIVSIYEYTVYIMF